MTEHKRPGMVDAENHVLRDENEADTNDGKRVAPSLALASAGFLVLEGIVCFFSQRTDPWHGYLWFALVVLLGVAVLLITAFRSSLYESTASFFRNSLGLLYAAHVFMALIFAAGLWSVGQDNAGSVVLIAIVDCFIAGRTFFLDRQSLAAVDNVTESANETRQSPLQGLSPVLVASLSFALLIVLAFAWSCASSFTYYLTTKSSLLSYLTPADLNGRILRDCAGEAMARLFLLCVIHAGVLLVFRLRRRSARTVVLACVLALGAWGYCWVMTQSAVGYARIWYGRPNGTPQLLCAAWIVPLMLPFAYVQYLSHSIHATLVGNTGNVVEQMKEH
ncbi:MAG: hypothetical protein ABFD13_03095 [Candidatus Cryosericum sp.]